MFLSIGKKGLPWQPSHANLQAPVSTEKATVVELGSDS